MNLESDIDHLYFSKHPSIANLHLKYNQSYTSENGYKVSIKKNDQLNFQRGIKDKSIWADVTINFPQGPRNNSNQLIKKDLKIRSEQSIRIKKDGIKYCLEAPQWYQSMSNFELSINPAKNNQDLHPFIRITQEDVQKKIIQEWGENIYRQCLQNDIVAARNMMIDFSVSPRSPFENDAFYQQFIKPRSPSGHSVAWHLLTDGNYSCFSQFIKEIWPEIKIFYSKLLQNNLLDQEQKTEIVFLESLVSLHETFSIPIVEKTFNNKSIPKLANHSAMICKTSLFHILDNNANDWLNSLDHVPYFTGLFLYLTQDEQKLFEKRHASHKNGTEFFQVLKKNTVITASDSHHVSNIDIDLFTMPPLKKNEKFQTKFGWDIYAILAIPPENFAQETFDIVHHFIYKESLQWPAGSIAEKLIPDLMLLLEKIQVLKSHDINNNIANQKLMALWNVLNSFQKHMTMSQKANNSFQTEQDNSINSKWHEVLTCMSLDHIVSQIDAEEQGQSSSYYQNILHQLRPIFFKIVNIANIPNYIETRAYLCTPSEQVTLLRLYIHQLKKDPNHPYNHDQLLKAFNAFEKQQNESSLSRQANNKNNFSFSTPSIPQQEFCLMRPLQNDLLKTGIGLVMYSMLQRIPAQSFKESAINSNFLHNSFARVQECFDNLQNNSVNLSQQDLEHDLLLIVKKLQYPEGLSYVMSFFNSHRNHRLFPKIQSLDLSQLLYKNWSKPCTAAEQSILVAMAKVCQIPEEYLQDSKFFNAVCGLIRMRLDVNSTTFNTALTDPRRLEINKQLIDNNKYSCYDEYWMRFINHSKLLKHVPKSFSPDQTSDMKFIFDYAYRHYIQLVPNSFYALYEDIAKWCNIKLDKQAIEALNYMLDCAYRDLLHEINYYDLSKLQGQSFNPEQTPPNAPKLMPSSTFNQNSQGKNHLQQSSGAQHLDHLQLNTQSDIIASECQQLYHEYLAFDINIENLDQIIHHLTNTYPLSSAKEDFYKELSMIRLPSGHSLAWHLLTYSGSETLKFFINEIWPGLKKYQENQIQKQAIQAHNALEWQAIQALISVHTNVILPLVNDQEPSLNLISDSTLSLCKTSIFHVLDINGDALLQNNNASLCLVKLLSFSTDLEQRAFKQKYGPQYLFAINSIFKRLKEIHHENSSHHMQQFITVSEKLPSHAEIEKTASMQTQDASIKKGVFLLARHLQHLPLQEFNDNSQKIFSAWDKYFSQNLSFKENQIRQMFEIAKNILPKQYFPPVDVIIPQRPQKQEHPVFLSSVNSQQQESAIFLSSIDSVSQHEDEVKLDSQSDININKNVQHKYANPLYHHNNQFHTNRIVSVSIIPESSSNPKNANFNTILGQKIYNMIFKESWKSSKEFAEKSLKIVDAFVDAQDKKYIYNIEKLCQDLMTDLTLLLNQIQEIKQNNPVQALKALMDLWHFFNSYNQRQADYSYRPPSNDSKHNLCSYASVCMKLQTIVDEATKVSSQPKYQNSANVEFLNKSHSQHFLTIANILNIPTHHPETKKAFSIRMRVELSNLQYDHLQEHPYQLLNPEALLQKFKEKKAKEMFKFSDVSYEY